MLLELRTPRHSNDEVRVSARFAHRCRGRSDAGSGPVTRTWLYGSPMVRTSRQRLPRSSKVSKV